MDPSRPGPPLTGGGLDRMAHRRSDQDWLDQVWSDALVVIVDNGRVLVRDEPVELVLIPAREVTVEERYFLGQDERGQAYFAVAAALTPGAGTRLANVREIGHALPDQHGSLFVTAVALVNWHARHAYSPKSGRTTAVAEAGWTRVTDDGEIVFPRTDPAVIVLVHDGVAGSDGRCLLGHNAAWTGPAWVKRYSCLAGFVEPGESAEATVAREVFEEVGVRVGRIRYVASQAWPFPGSLMLGFEAVADPAEPVRVDPAEITDARWFTRSEVAKALADEADFGLPMSTSIAHYLIQHWLQDRHNLPEVVASDGA